MIWIIFISFCLVISIFLNVASFLIIRNLFLKNEFYEAWISKKQIEINNIYQSFKEIDERQMFESDDYVGQIFKEMVKIISEFNELVK